MKIDISAAIQEVMTDPSKFMATYWREQTGKRRQTLEKLEMDEIQSNRGWYGFKLPECTWNDKYSSDTYAEANYRAWPLQAPGWIIRVGYGNQKSCILLRRALVAMPEPAWEELMEKIESVKDDYPLVDEDIHSEVEGEHQEAAWKDTYRADFKEALREKFEGEFDGLPYGDRIKEKFEEMLDSDEQVDDLFYDVLRDGSGGEWEGDTLYLDRVMKDIDRQDILQRLWPDDPRQMQFSFESLARSIVSRLLEDEGPHDYSCIMIDLPEELAERIITWGKEQISNDVLYVDEDGGCGREEETHVTVKYGLTAPHPDEALLKVFRQTKPFEVKLSACSLFENDEYDVIKLDAVSPELRALNRAVCDVADCPGDTFPDYHPHITIAYVKKGTCDRLDGKSPFDNSMKLGVTSIEKDGKFTAKEIVFSSMEGSKKNYSLGHPKLDAKASRS